MIYGLITLALICIGLGIYIFSIQKKLKQKIEHDTAQEKINAELKRTSQILKEEAYYLAQEKQETENKLKGLRSAVQAQENIFKSITSSNEAMRQEAIKQQELLKQQANEQQTLLNAAQQKAHEIAQSSIQNAEKQAEEAYQARVKALAANYEQKEEEYKKKYEQVIAALNKSILAEKNKLEDLEAKQKAYYEAQKRAQEITEQADFYRLPLSQYDISDIYLLRDLQIKFTRKDVIDKMVWEVYYRPAFDILTGKLFPNGKICGIYKITCLENNQAYVGQSVDIKERWRQHIKNGLSHSPTPNRLYQEMYKQGPENFTFEILEEVPKEKLNDRETYWIDFYKTKELGLNATKGGA